MSVYLVPLGVFALLYFLYKQMDAPSAPGTGVPPAPQRLEEGREPAPPPSAWQGLLSGLGKALLFVGVGIVAFFGLIILVCAAG